MSSSPGSAERFHALDALRAAMMFLGIYLHAVVAYSPNGGWPWKQPDQTRLLDWSLSIIHVFRMTIFYAMAGFFTALLIARYGMQSAAWNRFMRIVVPFVVGWMIVWPLVMLFAGIGLVGLERTLRAFASGYVLQFVGPLHLWFLEYLIVLYLLAVGLPKLAFVGTGAWFYMLVNAFKVPFSLHLGLITTDSLRTDAVLDRTSGDYAGRNNQGG